MSDLAFKLAAFSFCDAELSSTHLIDPPSFGCYLTEILHVSINEKLAALSRY